MAERLLVQASKEVTSDAAKQEIFVARTGMLALRKETKRLDWQESVIRKAMRLARVHKDYFLYECLRKVLKQEFENENTTTKTM